MWKLIKGIFIGLVFLLACSSAYAQGSSGGSDAWKIELTPYFWAPAIDADSTVSGQTAAIDMSFGDVLDAANDVFGLSARVEAWKGKWGLIFDGAYVDVGVEEDVELKTPISISTGIEAEVTSTILEFSLAYRTDEKAIGDSQKSAIWLEPYAGLRYSYLKQEIDLEVDVEGIGGAGTTLGGDEDWIEVFVGARMVVRINERWKFAVRGDVGGFGIGDASDLTWILLAGFDYKPWRRTSIKFGYKIYDIDYETGSGGDRFGFDGQMRGPWLGVTIHF